MIFLKKERVGGYSDKMRERKRGEGGRVRESGGGREAGGEIMVEPQAA